MERLFSASSNALTILDDLSAGNATGSTDVIHPGAEECLRSWYFSQMKQVRPGTAA